MPETLTTIGFAPHLACAYCLGICLCLPVLGCAIACASLHRLACGIWYQVQMLANADPIQCKAFIGVFQGYNVPVWYPVFLLGSESWRGYVISNRY